MTNAEKDESIVVKRVYTNINSNEKRQYFHIKAGNGQKTDIIDHLEKGNRENICIGELEIILGNQKSKKGYIDIGYKAPLEYKIFRMFCPFKINRYFSFEDAFEELRENHDIY